MKKKSIILAPLMMLLFALPLYAESTLALQEKCSKGAGQFVERLNNVESFISHYNKKRDQCFIRVGFYLGVKTEDITLNNKKYTLRHPQWMVSLYNVFDGKILGNCSYTGMEKQDCWIENTKCNNIDEFEKLIKPYLEE